MRVLALIAGLLILHSLPASATAPEPSPAQRLADVNRVVDGFLARVVTVDTRDPRKRERQVMDLRRDIDAFALESWQTLEWLDHQRLVGCRLGVTVFVRSDRLGHWLVRAAFQWAGGTG